MVDVSYSLYEGLAGVFFWLMSLEVVLKKTKQKKHTTKRKIFATFFVMFTFAIH